METDAVGFGIDRAVCFPKPSANAHQNSASSKSNTSQQFPVSTFSASDEQRQLSPSQWLRLLG